MKTRLSLIVSLMILLSTPVSLLAAIVFSDNFGDGDVTDWTKTTNHTGTNAVTVRTDSVVSADYALYTYLIAPPGGVDLIVHASHDFLAPVFADYTLDLWARSSPCSGCTISYDVLVDGVSLDRKFAPNTFEARSFDLTGLSAGNHTLTLGIYTTNASSGNFNASFDDVTISTTSAVPVPAALWLFASGLFGMLGARKIFSGL